jgi:hypothetical protein
MVQHHIPSIELLKIVVFSAIFVLLILYLMMDVVNPRNVKEEMLMK